VQPTGGIRPDLQAFFWLRAFSCSPAESQPAHQRLTQTVGQHINYVDIFWSKKPMSESTVPPTSPDKSSARYTITLGGSQWSVATYGIVEFLRDKWYLRGLFAILGVVSGIIAASSFIGYKIPQLNSTYIFIIITPWLFWIATVSGKDFELIFPEKEAAKERQQAEKNFEESQSPDDALSLDMKRLNEYYTINQSQARSSFLWAIFSMLLGFVTIIAGIWIFYFKNPQPDIFMSSLSTAAGCVINIVSGLFLYLHNKTQQRSLFYYQQLAQLQRVSLAIRLVNEHDGNTAQSKARNLVINQLLNNFNNLPTNLEQVAEVDPNG
jgi:hypothetical protein